MNAHLNKKINYKNGILNTCQGRKEGNRGWNGGPSWASRIVAKVRFLT